MSNAQISVMPMLAPPRADCAPGRWWSYTFTTCSGRTTLSGYLLGNANDVQAKVKRLLARAESNEGISHKTVMLREAMHAAAHRPSGVRHMKFFNRAQRRMIDEQVKAKSETKHGRKLARRKL